MASSSPTPRRAGDKADDLSKTDLWVVATDGKGKPTRLTGDRANDRHPKWSQDGKTIYFLGNRKSVTDGKTQVWMIAACGVAAGATAQAATRVEGGITGYDYSPKTDTRLYSIDTTATDNDDEDNHDEDDNTVTPDDAGDRMRNSGSVLHPGWGTLRQRWLAPAGHVV